MGEGAGGAPVVYIEDVFSTYLYTGTGATQTITNNIDLSTKGGLVWVKDRTNVQYNWLMDTVRGTGSAVISDLINAQQVTSTSITAFNSNGFTLGSSGYVNTSASNIVSWTFRKQPKFFDIVTYTGTGSNTTIAHSLGVVPGCIIVKRTDTAAAWAVYHRSLANTQYLVLNTTAAAATGATWWNSTTPTSTEFSLGTNASVNASGGTYVAYIYAHNAGGFGLAGTDNVISCGSFTTDGAGDGSVTLGYEPQWMLVKESSGIGSWSLLDNMRGLPAGSFSDALLSANLTTAEASTNVAKINTTGASFTNYNPSATVIYIAIRRGPMKVPTDATKVFAPVATTADSSTTTGYAVTAGFPVDLSIFQFRNASFGTSVADRLRGISNTAGTTKTLYTTSTSAEGNSSDQFSADNMTGTKNYGYGTIYNLVNWFFRRAPGFFDMVCYEGTGVARTVTHNLTVAPELVIIKNRGSAAGWSCGGNVLTTPTSNYLTLQSTAAMGSVANLWQTFSATTFGMGSGNPSDSSFNANTNTYVAYLFATCAGVSKVGTYTGTAAAQVINCGFTSGARFVLIKRTDSTGDWYVWDSARGIIAGNDPYLLLNSTAAEVTNTDYIDTDTTGFEISSTAPAAINASAGTFIFLAIA